MAAAAALHRALRDFGEGLPAPAPRPVALPSAADPAPPAFSRADLDRAVAQAETRLRDDLAREHEAAQARAVAEALAAERLAQAEAVRAAAAEQGASAAAAIAAAMTALQEEVSGSLAAACARVLAPVLAEDGTRRALAAMAAALREAFAERGAFRATLSGPAPLRARLLAGLADLPLEWRECDAAGFDLTAAFDAQVFETRIAGWAEALEGCTA